MDIQEKSSAKFQILTVFNQITTKNQDESELNGFLVVADQQKELIFWWRPYNSNGNSDKKLDIIIKSSQIQKIIVNYQQTNSFVLFSFKNSDSHQQFSFSDCKNDELIFFTQLLTLYQQNQTPDTEATLEDAINYISDSYSVNHNRYHLYDIYYTDNNLLEIPPDFCPSALESPLFVIVKPEIDIISQFNIHPEEYLNNPITSSEISTFSTLSELKTAVALRGIEPTVRPLLWPLILHCLPFDEAQRPIILEARTNEYLQLKNQWETFSKTQLKYCPEIRDSFITIKVDVKRTHPTLQLQVIPQWSSILTSVLRTFVIWNLDTRYTQGLNDLAINFMVIFLPAIKRTEEEAEAIYQDYLQKKKEVIENDKDSSENKEKMFNIANSVILNSDLLNNEDTFQFSGDLTNDQGEALSFWSFARFVENIASGLIADNMMIMQCRELKKILEIIQKFHPQCAKWLADNEMEDLQFMISSFILVFGRSFSQKNVARIWETLMSVDSPWLLMRYLSATLLILSFPSFASIPNCNSGKLISVMDKVFYKQDIGALIGIALTLMEKDKDNVNEERVENIKGSKKNSKELGKNPFFMPDPQYEDLLSQNENLFC